MLQVRRQVVGLKAACEKLQRIPLAFTLRAECRSSGLTNVFVERVFEAPTGQVLARFHLPYGAPGGEYRCRWQIVGLGEERSREAAGIDGIQSLLLAMRTVHGELSESEEYKAGRLTYLDQDDLDLPPTWGQGSLYDAGPSPSE
jgi:hypothetical protein